MTTAVMAANAAVAVPAHTLINTREAAEDALTDLNGKNEIGLDCRIVNWPPADELCTVHICTYKDNSTAAEHIYVFDVQELGWWQIENGLRQLLSRRNLRKYMWDCRQAADILQCRYNVSLNNIVDVQLLLIMIHPNKNRLLIGPECGRAKLCDENVDSNSLTARVYEIHKEFPDVWSRRPLHAELLKISLENLCSFRVMFECLMTHTDNPLIVNDLLRASENNSKVLASLMPREHSKYTGNHVLPLRVLPHCDEAGNRTDYPPDDTECTGCFRKLQRETEMRGAKCIACHIVDELTL